jgi:hypothetical protein
MGLSGLDGVWQRLRAGAVRSQRAFRAALGLDETRDRGVKNRWNFLGVIDGFLRSLPWVDGALGGDDRRLLLKVADLLAGDEAILSAMVGQWVNGSMGRGSQASPVPR